MGNELQQVDFKAKALEKVKSSFMDLIPDEAWGAMIDAVAKEFFGENLKVIFGLEESTTDNPEVMKYYRMIPNAGNEWQRNNNITGFQQVVEQALSSLVKEKIGEILTSEDGPLNIHHTDFNKKPLYKVVEDYLEKASPDMVPAYMVTMMELSAQAAIDQLKNQLRNHGISVY